MNSKLKTDLKVSVSGVRGIVGQSFTPALAAGFAAAFGQYVRGGKVIVGRDTRPSGQMIEHAVTAALVAIGCQPVIAGIIPTPTVQLLVNKLRANGGIVISASHNPGTWNALKFIGPSGSFLNHAEADELLDIYNQPDSGWIPEQDMRKPILLNHPFEHHLNRVLAAVNTDAIRKAAFRVAIDPVNGVGALFSRLFLQALGCEVFAVNESPDGNFARGPEPTPGNLAALSELVTSRQCHIGFAQDPDADRLGMVAMDGTPLSEQLPLVLAVEHVLAEKPGNVVVNIQTTKAVEDIASSYGCKVFYSKVGEINVSGEIERRHAVIGGEGGSGGVICPHIHNGRDSFTAMALILEMLALSGQNINEIIDSLPVYHSATVKIPCPASRATDIIRQLRELHASDNPITIDGIRLNFPSSWILIRASNTEPVIRLHAEARSADGLDSLIASFRQQIDSLR